MKIRFLIANAYTTGGTVRTTASTATELAARGHDVEIVSVYTLRKKPRIPPGPGVKVRVLVRRSPGALAQLGRRRGLRAWIVRPIRQVLESRPSRLIHPDDYRYHRFDAYTDLKLRRFLRSANDGVVIGTRAGLNVAIAKHVPATAVRVAQEHLHLGVYSPALLEEMRREYPRLDLVSTLTSRDAEAYEQLLSGRTRLVHIPNAVPPMPDVSSDCTAPVIVAAGRLTKQKAFGRLIAAFEPIAAKHPEWELRIFGDGNQRDVLRKRIDRRGLGDRVRLMGYTSELPSELAKASIYAMSSLFEGFPMTLLEAMACGLPVVSFDLNNGPRDLIDHGHNGLLVPDKDVPALTAALLELVEDPKRRQEMGRTARATVDRYRLPAIVDRWEAILSELAEAKRAAASR